MFNMKTAQIGILVVGISAATGVVAFMISKRRDNDQEIKELRKKLEDVGHDVVVFHRSTNSDKCVGLSPFDLKLETYLRIAGIKYYRDTSLSALLKSEDYVGQTWITVNGNLDLFGSQACIDYLSKKFSKDLSVHLTSEEKAIARCTRVLVEEHLLKLLQTQNYVTNCANENENKLQYSNAGDIQRACIEDLQAVSSILANKDFIVGDQGPTDVDITVFAFTMAIMNSSSDTCMLKPLLQRRLTNLDQLAKKIKSKYYSDWDDIWVEGENQFIADHSKLINSFSVEDSIKSQDDSEEEDELEESPEIDDNIQATTDELESNRADSDKVSTSIDDNIKQANITKGEPARQVTPPKSNNLVNHKFLKQIASAEENVKKLLGSPPKKQTTKSKSSTSNVKK